MNHTYESAQTGLQSKKKKNFSPFFAGTFFTFVFFIKLKFSRNNFLVN